MPETTKVAEPTASHRRVYFLCVDTSDLKTRLQASDMSTFTVKISKDGAAPATPSTATITELDATNMKGIFYWDGAVADWTGVSKLLLKVSNAGGTKTMEPREIVTQVVNADPYSPAYGGAAVTGTLTASSFTTNLTTAVADHWKGAFIRFTTGALAGQVKKVLSNTTGGLFGIDTTVSGPFNAAPANNDLFELIDS